MVIEKFPHRQNPGVDEANFYHAHGYLYVENFYDSSAEVEPILRDIHRLIGLLCEIHGVDLRRRPYSAEEFDEGLPYLIEHHRGVVSVLYDAVKKLPSYVRLACAQKNERYAAAILGSSFIGFSSRGYGIRMDNPNESQYSTQLHQDYVSQLSSQNATVVWSPLRRVTAAVGPITIYPGSHTTGVYPIVKTGDGSRGLVVKNGSDLTRDLPHISPEVGVGDCIFLDFLTLHESGQNRSNRTRWAMLSRYFDFNHASGCAIGWRGGLQEGTLFENVHPELVQRGYR